MHVVLAEYFNVPSVLTHHKHFDTNYLIKQITSADNRYKIALRMFEKSKSPKETKHSVNWESFIDLGIRDKKSLCGFSVVTFTYICKSLRFSFSVVTIHIHLTVVYWWQYRRFNLSYAATQISAACSCKVVFGSGVAELQLARSSWITETDTSVTNIGIHPQCKTPMSFQESIKHMQ